MLDNNLLQTLLGIRAAEIRIYKHDFLNEKLYRKMMKQFGYWVSVFLRRREKSQYHKLREERMNKELGYYKPKVIK